MKREIGEGDGRLDREGTRRERPGAFRPWAAIASLSVPAGAASAIRDSTGSGRPTDRQGLERRDHHLRDHTSIVRRLIPDDDLWIHGLSFLLFAGSRQR